MNIMYLKGGYKRNLTTKAIGEMLTIDILICNLILEVYVIHSFSQTYDTNKAIPVRNILNAVTTPKGKRAEMDWKQYIMCHIQLLIYSPDEYA